ncbi:MAG: acylneuraminate cytidylyltransferase family protein, partial [Deltaproteobacteria bacterium]|nr:acylneuraminate cytidylyltransferase family protein [Deltaproteobacteria bacterium]
LLQPTSPLRTTEDIEDAILMAVESSAEALVSVTEVTMHPYLTRVMDKDNILKPIIKEDNVKTRRRQDMPDVYGINGAIYINKLDSLVASKDFVPENTVGYIMPQERSVDIDTTWDFKLAEFLLKQDN